MRIYEYAPRSNELGKAKSACARALDERKKAREKSEERLCDALNALSVMTKPCLNQF